MPSGMDTGLMLTSSGISRPFLVRPRMSKSLPISRAARVGEVAFLVGLMPLAVALRHQHLDGLADEFAAGIAEQALRLLVGETDGAARPDEDQGIRRDVGGWYYAHRLDVG
jgi:hypothetical protein